MIHLFFFLLPCLFIHSPFALSADTISANQTLSGNQTIVSSGGNFELGFFKPGNSSRYYIGIWYKNVREPTYVWVANRETPIFDPNSAHLRISSDANLVLLNESQSQIWSTDLNSTSLNTSATVAVLRDDGNLILRDASASNSSKPLWESFNNPTDTWLPGGKLAYNKITKQPQFLISWKNSEDPAPGLFSLELDPEKAQYIIRWNRSRQYWSSGPWNGQIFSGVPEMRLNYIYNFSYINDRDESYFTYSLYNPSIISRFVMNVSGQIKQTSWVDNSAWNLFWSQPRQQCEVYSLCGAFGSCTQNSMPFCNCVPGYKPWNNHDWSLSDFSGGCVRELSLQCENNATSNGRRDRFLARPFAKPENGEEVSVGSASECESACLRNCSCTAYKYDADGCSVWNGGVMNLQQLNQGDGNERTINIKLSASSPVFASSKDNKGVYIGVASGAVVAVIVLAVVAVVWRRRRRTTIGSLKTAEGSLVAFGYRDLQIVTKNFSDKLGGGGFGSVFKGILPDSTVIAVKKLESISQGEKQFRTEVSTIGTIQHVNLVRLRGFCSDGNRKLLVYDYMPNGSLDSHLFNKKSLDWKKRFDIALGVARGLSYLHEKCRDCIIHCDIKPENILLDAELCPKVADFGLAKLVGRDFSRVLTTMRGTRGYLAPEWISGVPITAKADVYSYGMMLFELVSGRRNSESSEDTKVKFFPSLAAQVLVEDGDVLGLLDPVLEKKGDAEEVWKICKVACWCIQDDESSRPSMGQVVQILEGVMDVNLPPIPRSLQVFVHGEGEHIVFFTDSSNPSETSQMKSSSSSNISSNSKFVTAPLE